MEALPRGFNVLLAEANEAVEALSPQAVMKLRSDPQVLLVDLRDIREIERDGKVPGAYHMPRGMMEFWIDPDSPYFRSVFSKYPRWIFYCNKGWRSALSTHTAMKMGVKNIAHMSGGFTAWCEAEGETEQLS